MSHYRRWKEQPFFQIPRRADRLLTLIASRHQTIAEKLKS